MRIYKKYTYNYMCTYVYMCVCIYIQIYAYIHIYIHVYTCIYIYIHIYMYINLHIWHMYICMYIIFGNGNKYFKLYWLGYWITMLSLYCWDDILLSLCICASMYYCDCVWLWEFIVVFARVLMCLCIVVLLYHSVYILFCHNT